ncbi:hypothetical protein PVAP13_6KG158600 [Panicum virgatum]|uniref:Uncharacterized protein n=1 Tax=Panicum virgatum TaxID=38727 RepID=A0A8T0RA74_PANVG|nr:hypothetical protein PVAP13_6KG158600 [Panicum virgatum]
MASSAALRLAGRALCGRPSSFPRALVAEGERLFSHRSPMPRAREIICPRRLYSSERVGKAELDPKHSTLDPPATLENSGHQLAGKMTCVDELMSMKLDKIKSNYDEFGGMYKQILIALQEKEKREIRHRRVFAGGSILIGIGIYFTFFRHRQEAEGERRAGPGASNK